MKRLALGVHLLALGLFSVVTSAQPHRAPPSAPLRAFAPVAGDTVVLENGAKLIFIPSGSVPKVSIRVVVRTGRIDEGAHETGMAYLLTRVMKEGSRSKRGSDLARAFADIGSQLSVDADIDEISVGGDALTDYGSPLARLLAEVLQTPALEAADFERIKKDVIRELALYRSDPHAVADEAFLKGLFAAHPYGRHLTVESELLSYAVGDIQRFYDTNFGARRTQVYISGQFPGSLKKDVAAAFSPWRPGRLREPVPIARTADPSYVLIDRANSKQTTIRIGLVTVGPASADYVPFDVMDTLLAGSYTSRISTNLRANKGYSYSLGSSIISRAESAYWLERADVNPRDTGKALREILLEIERLRREAPTDEEMEGTKQYLAGSFLIRNSSCEGIIGQRRWAALQGLDQDWMRSYVPSLMKVTANQVREMAQKYLDPARMTLVIVGGKRDIENQIAEAGLDPNAPLTRRPPGGVNADSGDRASARPIH